MQDGGEAEGRRLLRLLLLRRRGVPAGPRGEERRQDRFRKLLRLKQRGEIKLEDRFGRLTNIARPSPLRKIRHLESKIKQWTALGPWAAIPIRSLAPSVRGLSHIDERMASAGRNSQGGLVQMRPRSSGGKLISVNQNAKGMSTLFGGQN
jgi:hypothetical protein